MDFHPHEARILKNLRGSMSPEGLAEISGLEVDAVLRACSWLKTKELIKIEESVDEMVSLGPEGKEYIGRGLPERQMLELIGDGIEMNKLKESVDKSLFSIGLGWCRKKNLVRIDAGMIYKSFEGKTSDELLLERIADGEIRVGELDDQLNAGLTLLKTRQNVVRIRALKTITISPTKEGMNLSDTIEEDERISQLTPKIMRDGSWKHKGFRPYDPKVWVQPQSPVRFHPLTRQIQKVRQIFCNMGFEEIKGPMVESAFWNFDALFQPQDHPAREMHDTFYLKSPTERECDWERYIAEVKKTHEDGGTTGSTGWGYKFSEEIAKKLLLRTHTTAVTARRLANSTTNDLPIKVFCIDKVFRNEAVDYKHLPEFYQVEGILADPSVTFKNLLGILKSFYDQMGFDKIRFRPAYFPYTEMSVEPEVYFEERGEWVELGGAGIFRPEVVKPLLGFDCPVLAWGLGLDRVVTLGLGLKDIRQLYIPDLDWLKQN